MTDGNAPAWNEVVQTCAAALMPLAQSLVVLQDEIGLVPVDGSQYALDLQQAADGGELQYQRALDVGSILGAKALVGYGHLYAIADVLRGPGVLLGPWTLLRSVVEGLSFGMWIMAGETVDERIQRCMTERLHGIYENRKLGNDAGAAAVVHHADQRIERIRIDAESLGFPFTYPDGREPYVGQQRVSAVDAARDMFGEVALGNLVYRRASQNVHGTMNAVVAQLGAPPQTDEEQLVHDLQPQATTADVALVTRVSITTGIAGLGAYYEYSGYAGETWAGIAAAANTEAMAIAAAYGGDVPEE